MTRGFLGFFMYFIQHCFICLPSDFIVSEMLGSNPWLYCDFGIGTLIKNKIKFSSYIRKFRVEQLQSHIMRKGFLIYEEAVSHIWLCNCSILNFLIFEEIFFISAVRRSNYSTRSHPQIPGGSWETPKTAKSVVFFTFVFFLNEPIPGTRSASEVFLFNSHLVHL
jgi:hypothetical protein